MVRNKVLWLITFEAKLLFIHLHKKLLTLDYVSVEYKRQITMEMVAELESLPKYRLKVSSTVLPDSKHEKIES